MRAAMRQETEMYFAYVVREDRPVTELIDSNYTFLNEDLAKIYGIPDVTGKDMRKVTLPAGSPRGGMLTQGSALRGHVEPGPHLAREARPVRACQLPRHAAAAAARERAGARGQRERDSRTA